MNLNNKIFLILILVISAFLLNYQETKERLNVLEIKNKRLLPILDSIIEFESNCNYFEKNWVFNIHLNYYHKDNTKSIIQISSEGIEPLKRSNIWGCFTYKNHLFIVTGRFFDSTILKETTKTKNIKFYEIKDEIIDGEVVIDHRLLDSYSYWIYLYNNGEFEFYFKHTHCN